MRDDPNYFNPLQTLSSPTTPLSTEGMTEEEIIAYITSGSNPVVLNPSPPESPTMSEAGPSLFDRTSESLKLNELSGNVGVPDSIKAAAKSRPSAPVAPIEAAPLEPIQAPIAGAYAPAPTPVDTSEQELADALAYQRNMIMGSGIAKAGAGIGAAMAGIDKPDLSNFDYLKDLGDLAVSGVKSKQDLKDKLTDREKKRLDLKQEQAMKDPTSPESQAYRSLAKTRYAKYGLPINDSMSAASLKALGVKLGEEGSSEFNRMRLELQRERMEMDRGKEARLGEAQEFRKEQFHTPSEKQTQTVTDFDNVIADMRDIEAFKPEFDTGPASAAAQRLKEYFGAADPKLSGFKARTAAALASYIKQISGTAAGEREAARLAEVLPKIGDQDDVFIERLRIFKQRAIESRQRVLQGMKQYGGKNIEGMETPITGKDSFNTPTPTNEERVDPQGNRRVKDSATGKWHLVK